MRVYIQHTTRRRMLLRLPSPYSTLTTSPLLAACSKPLDTVSTVIKATTSSLVAAGSGAGARTVTSRADSCPKKSIVSANTALESVPIVATAVSKNRRIGLLNCSCGSADVRSYIKKGHNHSHYLVHTSPYQRWSRLGCVPDTVHGDRIVCLARMKSRGGCPRRGLPIVDGGGLPRSDLGLTSAVAPYRLYTAPC